MKVAIIDEGVSSEFFKGVCDIKSYRIIDSSIRSYTEKSLDPTKHSHICARIITNTTQIDNLWCISILDLYRQSSMSRLRIALEWCLDNKIDIINLSLGSPYALDYNELSPVISRLVESGKIVVAACNNNDTLTIPASISDVIGVKCDKQKLLKPGEVIYNENDICGIDITAGSLAPLPEYDSLPLYDHNSFVTPYVTGVICNMFRDGVATLHEVRERLIQYKPSNQSANKNRFHPNHNNNRQEAIIVEFQAAQESKLTQLVANQMRSLGYNAICILATEENEFFSYSYDKYRSEYTPAQFFYQILNRIRPDIIFISDASLANYLDNKPDCKILICSDLLMTTPSISISKDETVQICSTELQIRENHLASKLEETFGVNRY